MYGQGTTHVLVPARIAKGNLISIRLKGIRLLTARSLLLSSSDSFGCSRRSGSGLGLGLGLGGLGLCIEGSDLKLLLVLLQDALVVIFPELLRRVLAGDALENLLAA